MTKVFNGGRQVAYPNDAPATSTGRPRSLSPFECKLDGGVDVWPWSAAVTPEALVRTFLNLAAVFCLPGVVALVALEAGERQVAALCEYWNPAGRYQGD